MKVFKCDICGNYYDPYEGKVDDYDVNAIVTAPFDDFHGTQAQRRYDCCPDCLIAFSQFLYDRRHPQAKKVIDQEEWRGE